MLWWKNLMLMSIAKFARPKILSFSSQIFIIIHYHLDVVFNGIGNL